MTRCPYLELGFGYSMFNLKAVVHSMWLDDRDCPGGLRADEGRSEGGSGRVEDGIFVG